MLTLKTSMIIPISILVKKFKEIVKDVKEDKDKFQVLIKQFEKTGKFR